VQARSALESTAPKARSRSRENVTLNEAPRISPRVSLKLPSLASSSLSSFGCKSDIRRSRVHWPPLNRCQHQSQMREGEPRGSKRRYNMMLGFASTGRDCDPVAEG